MSHRITCYIAFVTLLWGVHAVDEEKVRNMFKSNMTRHDFSHLLQSLIKLNEKRLNILHKLYRLEDIGVFSEMLRSGDKKTGNGNPNNLFLVVMSKNENDPSRRKNGFQLVDSVSSLNAGNNKNHPKLEFVLDPTGYFTHNIHNGNVLESLFGNFPQAASAISHLADDEFKQNFKVKFNKRGPKAEVKRNDNVLRAVNSLKVNEDGKYKNEHSRFKITDNKGKYLNAIKEHQDDDDKSKQPQTVGFYTQSNEYVGKHFTMENKKQTTTRNIIKYMSKSNRQKAKYSPRGKKEGDYDYPFSHIKMGQNRQYTKMISDISIKKYHEINLNTPETDKYIPKVKVQSNQQKDKLRTKLIQIEDKFSNPQNSRHPLESKNKNKIYFSQLSFDSPLRNIENGQNSHYTKMDSDFSAEKLHSNNPHKPKINKYIPKVKVQSKHQNDKLRTKPVTTKQVTTSNRHKPKYPLEGKDEDDYSSSYSKSRNNQNIQFTKIFSDISIKTDHKINLDNHKTNKDTPKIIDHSNQQKGKQSIEPITMKDILSSNYKNTKHPLKTTPFSHNVNYHNGQYTKIISDISIEKLHSNNYNTNKYTSKGKVQNNQQKDNLRTSVIQIRDIFSKPKHSRNPLENEDGDVKYFSRLPLRNIENGHKSQHTKRYSDISVENLHDNNPYKHEINKYTPKVKVQSKHHNDKLTAEQVTTKYTIASNRPNPLEGKGEQVEDDYSPSYSISENDSQYASLDIDIPKLYANSHQKLKTNNISPKVQNNHQTSITTIRTTKPNTIKYITTNNHQNTNYPLEGKEEQDKDDYGKYTNKNTDISVKKLRFNNYNDSKTMERATQVIIQINRHPKLNQSKSHLNNQGNKQSKIKLLMSTPKNDYKINGIAKKISQNNQLVKNYDINNDYTTPTNRDLLHSLASENAYGSNLEMTYPGLGDHKDARDNSNKDNLEPVKDALYGNYPDFENHKHINSHNKGKPIIAKDTQYGNYPDFEDQNDVGDSSNEVKPIITKGTQYGNNPEFEDHRNDLKTTNTLSQNDAGFEDLKVVRDKANKGNPKTTFGNSFHGFEHHKKGMTNLNKDVPKTDKELRHKDNPNINSKRDTDYDGVKMVDNGKSDEEFTIFITSMENKTAEVKHQNDPQLLNAFDKPKSKHIARKPFVKCLNKKASKLCYKSCTSAYKNVCRRLRCTSRAKKALNSECKRSCKNIFKSSSSKYSDENSSSDESDSDYSY